MRNSITCIKRMAAAGLAVLLALAILLAGGTTTALAAGPGIVVAWGDDTFGQLNVCAGWPERRDRDSRWIRLQPGAQARRHGSGLGL
jgi:hypothetical protein